MKIIKLVLIRHGESKWNNENRFTGWCDIDLSRNGHLEAKKSGKLLKKSGFVFDVAYTSLLKRAIHTTWHILDELDQTWLPLEKSWRLNERHYGALQGFNKIDIAKQYGDDQVKKWRRSFSIAPPALNESDSRFPRFDPRYNSLETKEIPRTESLEMTFNRVIPFWKKTIFPRIQSGKKLIISAHGNSLRALLKYLDNLNEDDIITLEIPTAIPIIYEFNENFKPIRHYYLK